MADPHPVAQAKPVVITFPAEIDIANADQIGEQLTSALAAGAATVVADMTATTFCGSSGIRILMLAHKQAAVNNAELRVVIPSALILRVLAITGADTVLLIYPGLGAALSARGPRAGA